MAEQRGWRDGTDLVDVAERRAGPDAGSAGQAVGDSGPPVLPSVTIIVLNWNKLEQTRQCLRSLSSLDYPGCRVVLVDNGSAERGIEGLAGLHPDMRIVRNPANLGYAGGNNAAMAEAFSGGADYVWLLNNDATPEASTLRSLVRTAEADGAIGMVAPVLRRDGTGTIEAAGVLLDMASHGLSVTCSVEQARTWQRDMPARVAVFGTALLIKRSAFLAVGGFDDRFFAYNEDIDLCIRTVRAGLRNVVDFGACVHHRERSQAGTVPGRLPPYVCYYMTRNSILLWAKHGGRKAWLKLLAWELDRLLSDFSAGRSDAEQARAGLAGIWDGFRGAGGAFSARRRMPWVLRAPLLARPARSLGLFRRITRSPA